MVRRPPRSTQGVSSAASDVYKRQPPRLQIALRLHPETVSKTPLNVLFRISGHLQSKLYRRYFRQDIFLNLKDFGEEPIKSIFLHLKCNTCLLYTSPSPRDLSTSRMPSSA
eukprot:TRINITY_DN23592_c0_g2_i2.p2 TRINITY_DN23592_c0_g2~~TRINITY_DN23592_c0_g2_i2.p2  ORF type:complete len:111 (-),score=16.31 TRINITY_DN23592_c0_g2_i2:81-413(-)